jgi:hypothetical protein
MEGSDGCECLEAISECISTCDTTSDCPEGSDFVCFEGFCGPDDFDSGPPDDGAPADDGDDFDSSADDIGPPVDDDGGDDDGPPVDDDGGDDVGPPVDDDGGDDVSPPDDGFSDDPPADDPPDDGFSDDPPADDPPADDPPDDGPPDDGPPDDGPPDDGFVPECTSTDECPDGWTCEDETCVEPPDSTDFGADFDSDDDDGSDGDPGVDVGAIDDGVADIDGGPDIDLTSCDTDSDCSASDCPPGSEDCVCADLGGGGFCVPGCSSDSDCPSETPYCDEDFGICSPDEPGSFDEGPVDGAFDDGGDLGAPDADTGPPADSDLGADDSDDGSSDDGGSTDGSSDADGGSSSGYSCSDPDLTPSTAVGSMPGDWDGVVMQSSAWYWNEAEGVAVMVGSEADNTCDVLDSIADGSYTGAAYQVLFADWSESAWGPGELDVTSLSIGFASDGVVDVLASAYIIIEGSGASYPLQGGDGVVPGTVNVGDISDSGEFNGTVDLNSTDASQGVFGFFSACHCEALDSFEMPSEFAPGG